VNSATVEHVVVPSPREAAKCYFSKHVAQSLILVGLTGIKHFFLRYQTVLCVAAGEPYRQPRYQTGT